jgi:hypothetical protein
LSALRSTAKTTYALLPKPIRFSYPLLIGDAAGVDLAGQLGNAALGLPYTLVISAQREVLLRRLGPLSESELDRILQQVLDALKTCCWTKCGHLRQT